MTAHCRIGMQLRSGMIVSIYCHSDGEPTGVGNILKEHYKTWESVTKLLSLGDISVLGTEPISCPDLWDFESGIREIAREHYYVTPFCMAYKDRDDNYIPCRVSTGIHAYMHKIAEKYNYLFCDDRWYTVTVENGEFVMNTIEEAIDDYS